MKLNRYLRLISILSILQLLRIVFKNIVFMFVEKTLITNSIVTSAFMLIVSIILIYIIEKKKIDINIFPKKFNMVYIAITICLCVFLTLTIIITKSYSLYSILSLIGNGIITVVFEEIIFRGYIYKEISDIENEKVAYLISTILFGVWHLGYIDSIIWRTSIFSPNADILNIMLWKMITGMVLGIVFGLLRYKSKNVYLSMIVHSLINFWGSI